MSAPDIFVPEPEGLSLLFHQKAVETGTLHVQRCDDCGHFRHPPRYRCPECFSAAWTFVPAAETGTIYSYVVSHRSLHPAWAELAPHVTVAVALDEGPRVVAALRDAGPGDAALGQKVRLSVEPKSDDFVFVWADLVG